MLPEVFVERFLLSLQAEPQRLTGLQVAHHGNELDLLAHVDFVHAHLLQRRLAPFGRPPFQVAQVNGAHRALWQPELPRHSPRRRAFACLPHLVFKPLGVGCLAGHLLDSLHLRTACHTIQAVHFHHYRGSELEAVQIGHLALPHRDHPMHSPPTTRTHKTSMDGFLPHPQLQFLGCLVQLILVNTIPRPSQ